MAASSRLLDFWKIPEDKVGTKWKNNHYHFPGKRGVSNLRPRRVRLRCSGSACLRHRLQPQVPFGEQFAVLHRTVPRPHQLGIKNVNCDWSDDVWSSRDCYLCRSLLECEFLSYGYRTLGCKNSVDLTYCFNTEFSYDCLYSFKCYRVQYSFDTQECLESSFLFDCRNCSYCFMCWNLRNKQYYIFNRPYSKEKYFEKLKEFDTHSWTGVQKLKLEFQRIIREEAVHRENFNIQAVNVSGNFITQSRNCFNCYFVDRSENARNVFRGIDYRDAIDCVGSLAERAALSVVDGYIYDTVATSHSSNCRHSAYLDYCEECEHCFGCVGLRKKRFCILNRQYPEAEYRRLLGVIKEKMQSRKEWGRFFPLAIAYCGYNFSVANIFFPETEEKIKALGGKWEPEETAPQEGRSGNTLPESITELSDTISGERIICPQTGRSFNISPRELAFYREYDIPPPRYHFDFRTLERFRPLALAIHPNRGVCVLCNKEITHYYAPELGYKKIACIDCYQREIL
jgi:hypothetical protein